MATVCSAGDLRLERRAVTGVRIRRVRVTVGGVVLALVSLTACGGAEEVGSGRSVTVTDSAGIRIVQNSPVRADAWMWTVRGPLVEIGEREAEPAYQLFRVIGAQRLSEGRIVVANHGSHELHFYDSLGRHQLSVGGEGDGPGEFRFLSALRRFAGDSLLTLDVGQGRVSVFSGEGSFVRSFNLKEDFQFPILAGVFADGSLLVYWRFDLGPETKTGVSRPDVELYQIPADGSARSSIGSFPGPENYMHTEEGSAMGVALWFGRSLQVAVAGDLVVAAPTDSYELRVLNRDGELLSLVRMEHDPLPLQPADFEALRNERLGRMEDAARGRWERIYEVMPRSRTLPAFRSLMADADGNFWVQDYLPPGDERRLWTVFDADGHALGKVETPEGLQVWEIGSDYVLGTMTDDLGVERVQLWGLEKRGQDSDRGARGGAA
jgi:hypothetical protein